MKLVVNGEVFEHVGDPILQAVLTSYGVAPGVRVAVVVNDEVVPQAKHATSGVREGDRIEVLVFAGGG